MTTEDRVKEIFLRAMELPESERAAFLAEACEGQTDLERRVEKLLRAHDRTAPFLAAPEHSAVGTVIDRYRIVEQLGEGGFGVVYRAEQERPVRRHVALKILKPGMDSKQVIGRFEAERQALAMMDHPGIARVFDAGTTDSGHPYFAMEMVEGVSITEYCDRERLGTRARIALLRDVCHAVGHAHRKGVIHRDLKPSNILVSTHDGKPMPKVIDFGIAKAIHERLTDKTVFTQSFQFIGTPTYMSPEQAGSIDIDVDTRSDIYSLGVLLYRLVSGTTPIDPEQLRAASLEEIQRLICDVDPPRPSTRLGKRESDSSRVAAAQDTSVERLIRLLRRDLDWVVMKALEKDRRRRYGSVGELAQELDRILDDEPVLAGPPSVKYKLSKFVSRHRVTVTVAAVILVMLVISVVGMTLLTIVAFQERDRAEQEARISELTNTFLTQDVLGQADPMHQPDPDIRLRTVLDEAAQKIGDRYEEAPLVEASIRMTIGMTYQALGRFQDAEEHLTRAHYLRNETLGPDDEATMRSARIVGELYWRSGRYGKAAATLEPLLERCVHTFGAEHAETVDIQNELAATYNGQGRFDRAKPLMLNVLEVRRRTLGHEHWKTLTALNNLGIVYRMQGDYERSVDLHREALEARERTLGKEHIYTVTSMGHLALALQAQGKYEETEPLCRFVVDARQRTLGPDHWLTLTALNNLGHLYTLLERYTDALPHYEAVLEARRLNPGPEHPETVLSMNNLGWLYLKLERYPEADPILHEMIEITERLLGRKHPEFLRSLNVMALLYEAQGRYDEADQALREMIDGFRGVLPEAHPDVGIGLSSYGVFLTGRHRFDEAQAALDEAEERLRTTLGPEHAEYKKVARALSDLEEARRKSAQ